MRSTSSSRTPSTETRTQSEGDLVSHRRLQRIADIDLVVGGIISAVFFALLLATGALMMQSDPRARARSSRCSRRWDSRIRSVMGAHPGGSRGVLRVLRGLVGLGLAVDHPAGGEGVHRHHLDADGRDHRGRGVRGGPGASSAARCRRGAACGCRSLKPSRVAEAGGSAA